MTDYRIYRILCRTRTGVKLHASSPGSSVTNCGHWLKVNASVMAVPVEPVVKALEKGEEIRNPSSLGPATLILCEHCFPTPVSRTAELVSSMYVTWTRELMIASLVEYAEEADSKVAGAKTQDEREEWQRIAARRWNQVPAS